MQKDRSFWKDWASFLQQWGLTEIAAVAFDAASPIHLLLAQFLYAGQPILSQMIPGERIETLTGLFEDHEESQSFAAFLREESSG